MRISIHPKLMIASQNRLALGVIIGKVKVLPTPTPLAARIEACCKDYQTKFQKAVISDIPPIKHLRDTYKTLGKKLSDFPGSNEALLKRVVKGTPLYKINNVVEINNLISIQSLRSVGTYDLSKVGQEIVFRPGQPSESYAATKRTQLDLNNLPVLVDTAPFGSPTSDSDRALIKEDTTDIMMVIFSFDGMEHLAQQLDDAKSLLQEYASATLLKSFIVNEKPLELDTSFLAAHNQTVTMVPAAASSSSTASPIPSLTQTLLSRGADVNISTFTLSPQAAVPAEEVKKDEVNTAGLKM
jgi:DNA/RNA-binding domain of Phe-tRNA-synthetase-like protein